ncbi:MAG: 16S rRNA (cytosine(1402)-N(4))-methyltransferase RsmH [Clostridiales bacterium]|nr:16S rRNA (cytosine(1402)-N(4))-methyltransferase RsmH [Clostridiales bacterium]
MEFKHEPVLYEEVIELLSVKPSGIYVDGTMGSGGHGEGICEILSEDGWYVGIDRDWEAVKETEKRLEKYRCKKTFIKGNFKDIKSFLEDLDVDEIDGALLDLGVSSYQLDNPERGFSYMQDAPLDMRMDIDSSLTAFEVVNSYKQEDLSRIIFKYGEERYARSIASLIIKERESGPIETTFQLVDIIKRAIPAKARREGPHPAKRTFQAIRIEVNGELSELGEGISDFIDVLKEEGRLLIISFHSLEDRIAKEVIQKRLNPCECPKTLPQCVCGKVTDIKKVTTKPVTAGEEELLRNPRARSAKLRVIEKQGA